MWDLRFLIHANAAEWIRGQGVLIVHTRMLLQLKVTDVTVPVLMQRAAIVDKGVQFVLLGSDHSILSRFLIEAPFLGLLPEVELVLLPPKEEARHDRVLDEHLELVADTEIRKFVDIWPFDLPLVPRDRADLPLSRELALEGVVLFRGQEAAHLPDLRRGDAKREIDH